MQMIQGDTVCEQSGLQSKGIDGRDDVTQMVVINGHDCILGLIVQYTLIVLNF